MTRRVLGDTPPEEVVASFSQALALCSMGQNVLYVCRSDREAHYLCVAMEQGFSALSNSALNRVDGRVIRLSSGALMRVASMFDMNHSRFTEQFSVLCVNPGMSPAEALDPGLLERHRDSLKPGLKVLVS